MKYALVICFSTVLLLATPAAAQTVPAETEAAASVPGFRVLDLLDEDFTFPADHAWESDPVSVDQFTLFALEVSGETFFGDARCEIRWQTFPGGPFALNLGFSGPGMPHVWANVRPGNRTALTMVQAPTLLVRCVGLGGDVTGALTDVKIILRRE